MKIVISGLYYGKPTILTTSGLGDLCWQLDCMGLDTSSDDEYFKVSHMSIEDTPQDKGNSLERQ